MEDEGKKTSQRDFVFAAFNAFHVSLSQLTVSRILKENWLTLKLFGRRSVSSSLPRDETSIRYYDELQRLNRIGILKVIRDYLWCIDVTTDSRRLELPRSWGRVGGKQRKIFSKKLVYTSSLVTLVNANGAQRGPYIFTYDPAFDPKGPLWKDVIKICKEYKLSPNEIFYVYDEKKQYFKEDRVMIDNVMRVSKPWEGHFFLSDKGNSFSSKGESVILDNGAEMHEVFDPPIHGKLSINDAHLHPIGKNDWVNNRREEWPQWRDLLYLAYAISTVPAQSTKKAWDKHFFLDRTPTVQLVDEML